MFPEITSAVALEYLQYANRELAFDMPLYTLEEDITLDGTNYDFSINANDVRVWSATYKFSATMNKPLTAVSIRELELDYPSWRVVSSSIPNVYSVFKSSDTMKIRLHPTPGTATTAGYPIVTLRVSRHVDLDSGGNLPAGLVAPDVYAVKAAHMYALDHGHVDRIQILEPMLRALITKNLQGFDFMVADAPAKVMTGYRFPGVSRRR